ncbi:undecaprenyl-diphosphatase [Halomonas halocynthiae]|uniref:undecaprenyl-diphosphatase n=1 Tax=Halomonas halocynthiae TaxID=176290 RepID=UPI0003FAE24B|nr:undecaprenyl-diphosphatase [Halomonas halocynthiae]
MEGFNVAAFLAVNQHAGKSRIFDTLVIGVAELMPYLFILVLLVLWLGKSVTYKKISVAAGCSVLLGLLTSHLVSLLYFHPRPFMQNIGENLVSHTPDTSFPSDHTTFLFCIAISLLFHCTTRKLGGVLLLLSLVGGIARVYVGVHYPLDIFGAAVVGGISAFLVFFLSERTRIIEPIMQKLASIKCPGRY